MNNDKTTEEVKFLDQNQEVFHGDNLRVTRRGAYVHFRINDGSYEDSVELSIDDAIAMAADILTTYAEKVPASVWGAFGEMLVEEGGEA